MLHLILTNQRPHHACDRLKEAIVALLAHYPPSTPLPFELQSLHHHVLCTTPAYLDIAVASAAHWLGYLFVHLFHTHYSSSWEETRSEVDLFVSGPTRLWLLHYLSSMVINTEDDCYPVLAWWLDSRIINAEGNDFVCEPLWTGCDTLDGLANQHHLL